MTVAAGHSAGPDNAPPPAAGAAPLASRSRLLALVHSHPLIGHLWLASMMGLAVAVQVLVWGIPKIHADGGAVLPGLRGWFGVAYAVILFALELLFGVAYRIPRAAAWVVIAGATVDVVFWIAHLAGRDFPTGAAASLTAAFGAVALGAGVLVGRLRPSPSDHDGR